MGAGQRKKCNRESGSSSCLHVCKKMLVLFLPLLILFSSLTAGFASETVSVYQKLIFSEKEGVEAVPVLPELKKEFEIKGLKKISNMDLIRKIPFFVSTISKTDLAIQRDSGEFHNFLKALQVDWNFQNELNVKFSWGTEENGIASAVWQVSTIRFSPDVSEWKNPPGFVASASIPIKDIQSGKYPKVFHIDFSKFAPTPFKSLKNLEIAKPAGITTLKLDKKTVQTKSRSKTMPVDKPKAPVMNIKKSSLQKIRKIGELETFNITYYVRVVPLDSSGDPIGLPSQEVRILYGDPVNDGTIKVDPSAFEKPMAVHPVVRVQKYVPIQNQANDAKWHVIAIRDIPDPFGGEPMIKKGQKFDLTPRQEDKNFLEAVGDFFSDVVSWVTDAVNWVSNAYESIKDAAIDIACSVAGEQFRGAFEMGLNIGMAAMGVPPGIPNFDELTEMGVDYLVVVATEQAIGVGVDPALAKEAAEKSVDVLVSEMEKQANGGGNADAFFKPDPDFYYRPAYLELKVTNTEAVSTNVVTGKVDITVKDGTWDEDLFHQAYFRVPSLAPGESFSLPIYLEENMDNKFEDHDYYAGMQRFWGRYHTLPAKVLVRTGNYETWDPNRPSGGAGDFKYENYEETKAFFTIQDSTKTYAP